MATSPKTRETPAPRRNRFIGFSVSYWRKIEGQVFARPAAPSTPAAASGRPSERHRNSGSFTRRRKRMIASPTRAPPATTRTAVRTTPPEERLRCSRMKLSGIWIDGRNDDMRGP